MKFRTLTFPLSEQEWHQLNHHIQQEAVAVRQELYQGPAGSEVFDAPVFTAHEVEQTYEHAYRAGYMYRCEILQREKAAAWEAHLARVMENMTKPPKPWWYRLWLWLSGKQVQP